MKNIKSFVKDHWKFLCVLFFLSLFQISSFLSLEKIQYLDPVTAYYPKVEILRQSIFYYENFLPLWQPYLMAGSPYLDGIAPFVLSYVGLFLLLTNNSLTAIILTFILCTILISLSMYILAFYLTSDKKASFIASLVYMFSGFMWTKLNEGALNQYCAVTLLPLIILFVIKAFKKDLIKNTVIGGILTALQILTAPDLKASLFTGLIVGCYLIIQLIGKNIKEHSKKVVSVSLLLVLVIFGLSAIIVVPIKENIELGSRAKLSYEESASRTTKIKDLFFAMVEGGILEYHYEYSKAPGRIDKYKIGIVAFFLALFGIFRLKKNRVIWFLSLVIIVTILFVTGSWFYYFLWKYIPPWKSFRYLERGYIMWSFAGSLLAAFGSREFLNKIEKKGKTQSNVVFVLICAGIILSLTFFISKPFNETLCNFEEIKEKNEGMKYLSSLREKETFRVHDLETRGIDWPTDPYTVYYNLEHIFGYVNNWDTDYMNGYLATSYQNPSKMWGNLNVKYVTSKSEVNITGFVLVKTFEEFKPKDRFCPPEENLKSFPNYIYENEKAMPRAWVTTNTIAIIGDKNAVPQITYSIMLSNLFDPKKAALIWKEGKIEDYSIEELSKYGALVLAPGSLTEHSQSTLLQYKQRGGKLFPDILKGEQQINEDEFLEALKGNYTKIGDENIKTISFEKKKIISPKEGWLVVSERYAAYPGWIATQNGKELKIERADGVISAVKVEEGEVLFEYKPKSAFYGKIITLTTLTLIVAYFIFEHRRKRNEN
ncbi:MAG: hypothetical protein QW331_03530 [Candidatus Woesearchaeota archaeon]